MSHPFKGTPSLPFDIVSHPPPPPKQYDVQKPLAELPEPRKHYKWVRTRGAKYFLFETIL